MSRLIQPDGFDISAHPAKKPGMLRFKYVEHFTHPDAEVMKRTLDMMVPLVAPLGLKARLTKKTLSMSGCVSKAKFADMMVGEFMPWSSLGKRPIRELFEYASLGRIYLAEAAQKAVKAPTG